MGRFELRLGPNEGDDAVLGQEPLATDFVRAGDLAVATPVGEGLDGEAMEFFSVRSGEPFR